MNSVLRSASQIFQSAFDWLKTTSCSGRQIRRKGSWLEAYCALSGGHCLSITSNSYSHSLPIDKGIFFLPSTFPSCRQCWQSGSTAADKDYLAGRYCRRFGACILLEALVTSGAAFSDCCIRNRHGKTAIQMSATGMFHLSSPHDAATSSSTFSLIHEPEI